MRRRHAGLILIALFVLFTVIFSAPSWGRPMFPDVSRVGRRDMGGVGRWVPGRVVVRLREGANVRLQGRDVWDTLGVRPIAYLDDLDVYLLQVPVGEEDLWAERARRDPRVRYAHPDYYYRSQTVAVRSLLVRPNDPLYASYQWQLPHVGAPRAWQYTRGRRRVKVAIIDSGTALSHEDLVANLIAGYDVVGGDDQPDDLEGHGTHVAGIVGAVTNNGKGVAGVAWNVSLMPVRVLDWQGSGSSVDVARGIRWAVDHGAQVLNLSLGGSDDSGVMRDAVAYAVERDVLLVAAAGNEYENGNPTSYPAAYPGVLAVASTDDQDRHASYSNTGTYVDVAAPGGDPDSNNDADPRHWITSTYLPFYGGYTQMAGTSQAAPHVSGLAALILSLRPDLTPIEAGEIITSTARDVAAPGWDEETGWGVIDMAAAMAAAATGPSTPTPTATATATPEPPRISDVRVTNNPINRRECPGSHWTVISAHVTARAGLKWVRLYYRPPAGTTWAWKYMEDKGGGKYEAPLGDFAEAGTVRYYIRARDLANNAVNSPTYTLTVQDCGGTPTPTPTVTATPTPTSTRTPTPTPAASGRVYLQNGRLVFGQRYNGQVDAHISAWYPDQNFGESTTLTLRSGNVYHILVRFSLPDLPPGATVTRALLQMYATYRSAPVEVNVDAYPLLRPWRENGVTWRSTGEGMWQVPGASGNQDRAQNRVARKALPDLPAWLTWNVTGLVQDWYRHPEQNHGLLLVAEAASNAGVQATFLSGEWTDVQRRPRLVIDYVLPSGETPTPTPTPTTSLPSDIPRVLEVRTDKDTINRRGCPGSHWVTVSARVSAPAGVRRVMLYYIPPNDGWDKKVMEGKGGGWYEAPLGDLPTAGTLHFFVWVEDARGGTAQSAQYSISVRDCALTPTPTPTPTPTGVWVEIGGLRAVGDWASLYISYHNVPQGEVMYIETPGTWVYFKPASAYLLQSQGTCRVAFQPPSSLAPGDMFTVRVRFGLDGSSFTQTFRWRPYVRHLPLIADGTGSTPSAPFLDGCLGHIRGVVYEDSNGNGRRDAGEPVLPGVMVEIYNLGQRKGKTWSNGEGKYVFSNLDVGTYALVAYPKGGMTPVQSTTYVAVMGARVYEQDIAYRR